LEEAAVLETTQLQLLPLFRKRSALAGEITGTVAECNMPGRQLQLDSYTLEEKYMII